MTGRWFQFFLNWFLSFTIAWVPMASRAAEGLTPEQNAVVSQAEKTLAGKGWTASIDQEHHLLIETPPGGGEGDRVEFELGEQSELIQNSPSHMNQNLMQMRKAPVAIEQLVHLPATTLAFMTGMGAMIYLQSALDNKIGAGSSDPIAQKHNIEGNLSPYGLLSLYIFSVSQGYASNVIGSMVSNPKLLPYVPLGAMGAAFFIQSQLSSFASDPSVRSCVAALTGNETKDLYHTAGQEPAIPLVGKADPVKLHPCDEAFSYYVVSNHLSEMVPGLLSMITTFAVMAGGKAAGQAGASFAKNWIGKGFETSAGQALLRNGNAAKAMAETGAKWVGENVLRMRTVDIALTVTPEGWVFKVGRFIQMGIEMAVFTTLQTEFGHPMTRIWRNEMDGRYLYDLQGQLEWALEKKKKNGWANELTSSSCTTLQRDGHCDSDFPWLFRETQNRMNAWRIMNMSDIYEANQNWTDFLAQFAGRYAVAFSYYNEFIQEARNSKWRLHEPYRLEIPYPLLGVYPMGLKKVTGQDNNLKRFTRPIVIQDLASKAAWTVGAWLRDGPLRQQNVLKEMTAKEIDFLTDVSRALLTSDEMKQGDAIQSLISRSGFEGKNKGLRFASIVDQALNSLAGDDTTGGAQPLMELGHGFAASFERWSPVASGGEINSLEKPKVTGPYQTPNFTDHLLVQMICGPDLERGGSVVGEVWHGYPLEFQAPQIVSPEWKDRVCTKETLSQYVAKTFPSQMFSWDKPASELYERHQWPGDKGPAFSVLSIARKNIRPNILGTKDEAKSTFIKWWDATATAQVRKAFDDYQNKYEGFVKQMMALLNPNRENYWKFANAGPVSNQGIPALRQAYRLDLLILGELFRDIYRQQHRTEVPAQLLDAKVEPVPTALSPIAPPAIFAPGEIQIPLFPLIEALGATDDSSAIYEWDRLTQLQPQIRTVQVPHGNGHALQFQKEIETNLEAMIFEVHKASIDKNGHFRSALNPDAMKDSLKKIQNLLWATGDQMGVSVHWASEDGDKNPGKPLIVLNEENKEIVRTAINNILVVANELLHFGTIANSADFDKLSALKKAAEAGNLQSAVGRAYNDMAPAMLNQAH